MRFKLTALIFAMLLTGNTHASDNHSQYKVTITNLTRAQVFTPVLVVSHRRGVHPFEVGEPASDELAAVAEGGDIMPLQKVLSDNKRVIDTDDSGGLLEPGQSVTVFVAARENARRISLVSMLIPTNDSFIGLSDVAAPRGHNKKTYWVPAYDAGSEPNDELCINMPGPVCGGEGGSPGAGGEGYVHISSGIHGIGDLAPATYDWRNPVAKVTVQRVRSKRY